MVTSGTHHGRRLLSIGRIIGDGLDLTCQVWHCGFCDDRNSNLLLRFPPGPFVTFGHRSGRPGGEFGVGIMAFTVSETCPDCGELLVVRTNKKQGNLFLGCRGYPLCKYACGYDHEMNNLAREIRRLDGLLSTSGRGSGGDSNTKSILKKLVFQFHPDRNDRMIDPLEITKAITAEISKL